MTLKEERSRKTRINNLQARSDRNLGTTRFSFHLLVCDSKEIMKLFKRCHVLMMLS
jgi:hypothetical protein